MLVNEQKRSFHLSRFFLFNIKSIKLNYDDDVDDRYGLPTTVEGSVRRKERRRTKTLGA